MGIGGAGIWGIGTAAGGLTGFLAKCFPLALNGGSAALYFPGEKSSSFSVITARVVGLPLLVVSTVLVTLGVVSNSEIVKKK